MHNVWHLRLNLIGNRFLFVCQPWVFLTIPVSLILFIFYGHQQRLRASSKCYQNRWLMIGFSCTIDWGLCDWIHVYDLGFYIPNSWIFAIILMILINKLLFMLKEQLNLMDLWTDCQTCHCGILRGWYLFWRILMNKHRPLIISLRTSNL